MSYSDFLSSALLDVSKIAKQNFGKVTGVTKQGDNNQVLTETDIAVGKHLVGLVEEKFPDHNIIDEEAGVIENGSKFTWVIDPIDGTSNFAQGLPMYGIMIGLLENEIPIAGAVALPYFDEIYIAEKDKGAFCNGQQIQVTQESNLLSVLASYGIDGHQENPQLTYDECKTLAEIILNICNLRSNNSVFDIMQVAKGKYGAYLNRSSKIWDNIAPQIIIEEAGGVYTDFFGMKIDYSNPTERATKNFTACAASSTLHQQLQEIIHK